VFFIVDANYFGVSLLQAKQALLMSGPDVAVHVFLEGFGCETEEERRQFDLVQASAGGRLFLHRQALSPRVPEFFPHTNNLPKVVYGRFYAPEIINAERILYLDADILIRSKLDDLFSVQIGAHPVAAVHDYGFVSAPPSDEGDAISSIRASGDYFNAGVLLIDRERWLKSGLEERARAFFSEHGAKASLQDQDFLNWIYRDNWAQLSPRWNFQAALMSIGLQNALEPAILHYSGSLKPWHAESRELFRDYAEEWRQMSLRSGIPQDWKPKRGRVAYAKTADGLKNRIMRVAAELGLSTGKMRKRLTEWQDGRERSLAFIEDMVRRDAFADPVSLKLDGKPAEPRYDGRRYWAAA
jgi:lipopolysaccharide biosynthesis glycosyltransferase